MRKPIGLLCLLLFAISWSAQSIDDSLRKYWYQGKAELTRYGLKQARYGEIHQGEAVLIFVTEPFLSDKQVKYEHGDKSKAQSVLKLNFTRKFYTGIYPYSLMTSTFTPVDYEKQRTLKVTSSSQEWCGHTFMQMNWRNGGYDVHVRSYFQDETDQNFKIPQAWLEDEFWTHIRLAPETLPVGDVEIVPGLQFVRLWHKDAKPVKASAKITENGKLQVYSVDYPSINRQLIIRFQKQFPY
ncbi:septum formation inhibitor Maf, partial [bacterium]|nr:septum formation inhibitor Maf [bacterium]